MKPHDRYAAAHLLDFQRKYPIAYAGGHYFKPDQPDCRTSNGLTQSIIKFILWNGYYANRISSTGRLIDGTKKQPSGAVLTVKKWIRGNTQRGTADIHAVILGRHISIEVKVGKDVMSEYQHEEKKKIEKAGGIYIVVKSFEDFIEKFDNLFVPC